MKASPDSTSHMPVGIWIRVSTDDQAKGESPEHHEQRARMYAGSRGWNVKEVYDLSGVSGKSVMGHPEAKRMLADIERGHIRGLIFSKLARLARNTKELLEFSEFFRAHRADLVSLQESIDTSTPSGRLFYTMIAAMAQWEREEIADRVKASVAIRAKLGKPLSGVSPFGYRWVNKQLVLEPKEAPVRKLIYELFLQHRRKGVVARLLNQAGHRTRAGARWSDVAVHRLIVDPTAKGLYRMNRVRSFGHWQWEEKPENEWNILAVEPIVNEQVWAQCNQILEEHQKSHRRPGKKPVHLFAGLAHCACGHRMYVRSNSPKYVCTKCHNKIPIVDLEAIFHDELKAFFATPEKIASHLRTANEGLAEQERLLKLQEQELTKTRQEMAQTHKLYLAGQIALENFGTYFRPLEERAKQLEADILRLQAEVDRRRIDALSADEVFEEARQLHARWPEMPVEDRRKIVECIVEKIVIGKGEIDITFSYLPPFEDVTNSRLYPPRRSAPVRPPGRNYRAGRFRVVRWRRSCR